VRLISASKRLLIRAATERKQQSKDTKLHPKHQPANRLAAQSIVPPLADPSDPVMPDRIENSLVRFIETDSYMAKVSGSGMTNSKALAVLAGIERKLAGEFARLH
jgi:hypothetical protein